MAAFIPDNLPPSMREKLLLSIDSKVRTAYVVCDLEGSWWLTEMPATWGGCDAFPPHLFATADEAEAARMKAGRSGAFIQVLYHTRGKTIGVEKPEEPDDRLGY